MTRKNILITAALGFSSIFSILTAQPHNATGTIKVDNSIEACDLSSVNINGYLGQKLDVCIENGVMAKNYDLYSIAFKDKIDKNGGFAGEFWGKWFTSAALGYGYQPTAEHKAILDKSVKDLMASQESDGRISSYPKEVEFLNWDIWGRKYVLLGLISYYDQTGDENALKAACRATDALIEVAGPGKQKLTETGLQVLGSMSSVSILEPIVLVYQRSGEKKYLDFAEYLVELWSEPNAYTSKGLRLVEDALAGVHPALISSPKAYELMSCYEGICELYRATGDKKYLEAVVKFGKSLIDKEIMIVGSGSSAELWCDGANRQTQILEQPMETCVTVTWMKYCFQLLQLTGDPIWADQLEISLYNALLGAMNSDGSWWAYFSPLLGERMPSPMQMPVCESSCCVVNGPRGLLITPQWSVMKSKSGPVVNLYAPGTWSQILEDGTEIKLVQETDYPVGNTVEISILQKKQSRYTISLRIPEWSKNTEVWINDEIITQQPGNYAKITRKWKNGDKITLKLDMRGRILTAPGSVSELAIMRGPIVLAMDNRMVEKADYNLWLYQNDTEWTEKDEMGGVRYVLPKPIVSGNNERYVELKPLKDKPENVWMAYEVPFLYKYTHFFNHSVKNIIMCDYASAGNEYSNKNMLRVWLPQPMFMNYIFPEDTWKILYREGDERPVFPNKKKRNIKENAWERSDKDI